MIHSTTDERGVVTLTIDRPERRNALDRSTMRGIAETLAVAENGTHIRALVVRGNGGTFSAGRDLKEAAELKLDDALDQHRELAWSWHCSANSFPPNDFLLQV